MLRSGRAPVADAGERAAGAGRPVAHGSAALLLRQGFVHGVNALGAVVLARHLGITGFGAWSVLAFGVALGTICVNLGLVEALIHAPRAPTRDDERRCVRLQLASAVALVLLAAALAPLVADRFRLGHDAAVALSLAPLSWLLVPAATVPLARLQRRLAFVPVAAADLAHAVTCNGLAALLVLRGHGLVAIAAAYPCASLARAVMLRIVQPAAEAAGEHNGFWSLAAFGATRQAATLVATAKDALIPVFLGLVAGATAVGQVGWAQMAAAAPVLLMMPLQRLYLPAFARLQKDPEALGRLVDRVVFVTNAVTAPVAVLMLAFAVPLTRIVFGPEWVAALPLVRLLWCANLLVATATPLLSLFAAVGRADVPLAFGFAWMALTWLLGAPLILGLGPLGYAVAHLLVQLTHFELFRRARALAPMHLARSAAPGWVLAALAGTVALALAPWVPPALHPWLELMVGATVYAALLAVAARGDIAAFRAALR